jgi:hypothetical protein
VNDALAKLLGVVPCAHKRRNLSTKSLERLLRKNNPWRPRRLAQVVSCSLGAVERLENPNPLVSLVAHFA